MWLLSLCSAGQLSLNQMHVSSNSYCNNLAPYSKIQTLSVMLEPEGANQSPLLRPCPFPVSPSFPQHCPPSKPSLSLSLSNLLCPESVVAIWLTYAP